MDAGSGVPGRLSFVVPVFNEVEGIEVLWSTMSAAADRAVAATRLADWEAILVDDGSTDGSADAIDALVRADGRCRTVRHRTNTGLGAALRSGLDAASGEVIVYTDADLPFDLDHLGRLLGPVLRDDADLVCGKRIGRAREGWWRAVQSFAYNAIVQVAFGLEVSDVNFACKVANRRALPDRLLSDSGFADVEWLVRARQRGCRLVHLPVEFIPRTSGRSTLGGVGTVPAILRDLVTFRSSVRPGSSWRSVRSELLLRFADESWPTRLHVRARLATAPLAEIVAAVGAVDHVVDIGCGHGLVSLALAAAADRPSVLGVDLDPGKIAIACRAAATDPRLDRLEFSVVRTGWRPPPTAAIVLADVLYLLDPAQQAGLVAACAAALAPGGTVVVKEVDDRPRWKAVFARAQEVVAVRKITKRQGNALSAPPARLVRRWLAEAGLEVTVTRHDAWRPWPHYLAVGRKRGPAGDEA